MRISSVVVVGFGGLIQLGRVRRWRIAHGPVTGPRPAVQPIQRLMTPSAEENAATRKVIDLIVGLPPVIAASALTRALATVIREGPIDPGLKLEMARNLASTLIALVEIKAPEEPERPLAVSAGQKS